MYEDAHRRRGAGVATKTTELGGDGHGDGRFIAETTEAGNTRGAGSKQREAHAPPLTWLGGAQRDTTDAPLDALEGQAEPTLENWIAHARRLARQKRNLTLVA